MLPLAELGYCWLGWAAAVWAGLLLNWDKLLLAGLDPKTERLKSKTTGASSSSAQQAVA